MDKKFTLSIDSRNLDKIVANRKSSLETMINDFMLNHYKTKIDKLGNVIDDTNPLVISNYFFKSINPMNNVEPIYTSEQLSKVYELYSYLIEQVNLNVSVFQPTISHFAKFAGISLTKFQELRNSVDENMRALIERINSDVYDANMTLAQHQKLTERPTTFRMRVENEMVEKRTPNINVNVSAKTLDLDKMQERLYEIKKLTKKQINYEEE